MKKNRYLSYKREKSCYRNMRYGLVDGGIKLKEKIAEILGISRSYVSRIEKGL